MEKIQLFPAPCPWSVIITTHTPDQPTESLRNGNQDVKFNDTIHFRFFESNIKTIKIFNEIN